MRSINPSREAAEARYRPIRLAALGTAADIVSAQLAPLAVRLDTIGPTALEAFREQWEGHPRRRYPWPWGKIVDDARKNEPDRIEVAVWSGKILCGLAIGRNRSEFCRVDYLEGAPAADHPLKGYVAMIVAGAAVAYATASGKGEVRLVDPIPAVVSHYVALGFALATPKGMTPYCWWKVK